MSCFRGVCFVVAIIACHTTCSLAQEMSLPKPGPELDVFKSDIGSWDVTIKAWAGPGEPTITKGKETNRMLGGFWLLTDFSGNMMGLDFVGHGMYSYDATKKQYIGSWVDSLSSSKMEMVGKYDPKKQTLTYEGMAPNAEGKLAKHVLETTYGKDGSKVVTMHMDADGTMLKIFEMSYAKAK
ncbi:MAG: DUF1579 family protein [Planctomycetota bacterium]